MNRCTFLFLALFLFYGSLFSQVDTVPPVLVCKGNSDFPTYAGCLGAGWVFDFIDTAFDDTTPAQNLVFGIRKVCLGTGFPLDAMGAPVQNVAFTGSEWGEQAVEIWAKDIAGNVSSCIAPVFVFDATGSCDPFLTISANTPEAAGINQVAIDIKGSHCYFDSIDYRVQTNPWGNWGGIGGLAPTGAVYSITPSKDTNYLNGVTTYDLALIQKHILGLQLLDSPYKIIAADANQDGQVTSYDIVILRKLILGYTDKLPHDKSWRFMPSEYVFPDPLNPFQPAFPERIDEPGNPYYYYNFIGVKIGDVDYSADPDQ